MQNELQYQMPEPEARNPRRNMDGKPLNRRSILNKVALGSSLAMFSGFEVIWPSRVNAYEDTANQDKDWGAVKGRIVWQSDSAPPKPREIDFSKYGLKPDDLKWFTSKGPVYAEDWVVEPNKLGIKWVYVWLIPSSGGTTSKLPLHPSFSKTSAKPVTFEQPCSGFAPHAVAVRQGQKLVVTNESPVIHAFQWTGFTQTGNQIMNPGSKIELPNLVAERQALKVSCGPHPWESAWIRVFNHPYFTLTDAEGRFEIRNAPKGNHRIVIWHETAGWLGGNTGRNGEVLTVEGGAIKDLGDVGMKPMRS
jgi:hypothetical protein